MLQILYNLNMTKTDKVTASVKQGVKEMDFNAWVFIDIHSEALINS